ncbi:MAG: phosphoribosylformylglycinamidine cyclo-ligase [Spirochaetes bacterium]|nr:phosphoribosylformylglycinamidine cyclo-ligase [Spirochaetota bacterium]
MGLTYKDSGVDIKKGDNFVNLIKEKLRKNEQDNIGLFGGLFSLDLDNYKDPVLVSGTDGVGTKLLLAKEANKYSTIGIDLVAMCVNDIVTLGAKPLFFLDYMACSELEIEKASELIDGIIEGCRLSGCILLGGETAEMPGVYQKGDYELAGFGVGIVEKTGIIDGRSIQAGDVLVGIRSSGIHSNGLSLARRALFGEKGFGFKDGHPLLSNTLIEELLVPTRIYVELVLEIIRYLPVNGIAHITGGGIFSNVKRLLPAGLEPLIDWDNLYPQPIFTIIEQSGKIHKEEMRNVFNMGIGLVFVVSRDIKERLISRLEDKGEHYALIGGVVST